MTAPERTSAPPHFVISISSVPEENLFKTEIAKSEASKTPMHLAFRCRFVNIFSMTEAVLNLAHAWWRSI